MASMTSTPPGYPAAESDWGVDATCPVCRKDVEVVLGGIEKLANHNRGESWCSGSGTRIVPGEWKKRTMRRASPLPSASPRGNKKSNPASGRRALTISQAADAGLTDIELQVECPGCGQSVGVVRQRGAALRAQHRNQGSACPGSQSIVDNEELADVEASINAKIRTPRQESSIGPALAIYHEEVVTEWERAHLMSRPRQYDQ